MVNLEKKEDFATDVLKKQLADAGIDISSWGTGQAKTLAHLQEEIKSGETILITGETGKLLRKVVIVGADIYYRSSSGEEYRLREDRQVFKKDGRERRRDLGQAVSEKMKPDQDPKTAMIYGIQEELGISGKINLTKTGTDEQKTISFSYPGLEAQYIRYKFQAVLNDEQFNPDGYVEEQPDKSTYFIWEEVKKE